MERRPVARHGRHDPGLEPPWAAVAAVLAALCVPFAASALERIRSVPADDSRLDPPWSRSAACEISYYNVCNDALSVQDGPFRAGDRVGVVFDACCERSDLVSTWTYFDYISWPTFWGYTFVSVQAVDANGCPSGLPIASHVREPAHGWILDVWNTPVPPRFAVVSEFRSWGRLAYNQIVCDHPAGVAGGPPACGSCYPVTRETRTFFFGRAGATECPGVPFFDGTCNAEMLVTAQLECATALEPGSWASVKALYR